MVIASELKEGTVIRVDGRIYGVLEVESKPGGREIRRSRVLPGNALGKDVTITRVRHHGLLPETMQE